MTGIPEDLHDLFDEYLNGQMDEQQLGQLQVRLLADPEARRHFVRYCALDTELQMHLRAERAGDMALHSIDGLSQPSPTGSEQRPLALGAARSRWRKGVRLVAATAAVIVAIVGASWWLGRGMPGSEIAWLANAQNCRWADDTVPAGNLQSGSVVGLKAGLAEFHFRSGARVILDGPATLELVSANSAKLLAGRLTAQVPEQAIGFQILSPQGKVIDLGTEFGMAIADNGSAEVVVFSGKVEAYGKTAGAGAVSLTEHEAARIGSAGVVREAPKATGFVRSIVPPPIIVPRSLVLDFRRPVPGSIRDRAGQGTGLTHRLPGTGGILAENDANLLLVPQAGHLELGTTNSDLNTRYLVEQGEYLGVRLADLGFTGREDFSVTVLIPSIPALREMGQFGLYAGTQSDRSIRGGVISRREPGQYTQFLVNNQDGRDSDACYLGVTPSGDDLQLTLQRSGGHYSLTVEDRSAASTSSLSIRHPSFLDDAKDLFVGIFGANTQSTASKTLVIKQLKVVVETEVAP